MEMIRAAEAEAKEILEAAEQYRRERLLQAEQQVLAFREEQLAKWRQASQDYIALEMERTEREAEQTIRNGREATERLETAAKERMDNAVAVVLRKVL